MSRSPGEWWGTERSKGEEGLGGIEQADKISSKTFLDLQLNIEGGQRKGGERGEKSIPLTDKNTGCLVMCGSEDRKQSDLTVWAV